MSFEPDDDLLKRWLDGWCLSRGMGARREGAAAWLVDVGDRYRAVERLAFGPPRAELERLVAATLGHPDAWLTVVGALDDAALARLAALRRVTVDERMMAADLAPIALPAEVSLVDGDRPGVVHAAIVVEGQRAAWGQAAVVGTDVIVDKIGTDEGFRRRGLASLVMAGLTGWAVDSGAATGLLMASAEGRALYARLGWREVAPLASFAGA